MTRQNLWRLLVERHEGENWIEVGEAAKRLSVPVDHLHRRARHIEIKRLGEGVYVREADVQRFAAEGLPEPHLEGLADGSLVELPESWYVTTPPGHKRPHAYIILKPGVYGNREFFAGDILPPSVVTHNTPLDRMATHGQLGLVPVDSGVMGLLRVLLERERVLEAFLALFAARAEARTGSTYTGDRLIEQGLITGDQFDAARAFHNAPDPDDAPAVNTDEGIAYYEAQEREFVTKDAPAFSGVRPGPVKE